MDLDKIYHDIEGKECNILQLIKREPEWAANIIQEYEKNQLAVEADAEKPANEFDFRHADTCPCFVCRERRCTA